MTTPAATRLVLVPAPPPARPRADGRPVRRYRLGRVDRDPPVRAAAERFAYIRRVYD